MKQQKRTSLKTTTKRALWFCLGNGVGWVWCSYILAYLGKESIAEKLSQTAVTEIVGVVALYCLKSLFEKRKGFGAVGKKGSRRNRSRNLKGDHHEHYTHHRNSIRAHCGGHYRHRHPVHPLENNSAAADGDQRLGAHCG